MAGGFLLEQTDSLHTPLLQRVIFRVLCGKCLPSSKRLVGPDQPGEAGLIATGETPVKVDECIV